MKIRARRLTILVLCCIVAVLGAGMGTIRAFASYQGNSTGLTEQELYNQTNTYNVSGDCFNENGTFKSVSDSNYENPQYRLSYVMTSKNSETVPNTTPKITVLTHGLGADAATWSNQYSGENSLEFDYDKDSLINAISDLYGGASIYLAAMTDYRSFCLYDLTGKTSYAKETEITKITDISKHIIVIFDAGSTKKIIFSRESNDNVYYQFNYMLSRIVYDVKKLNNNKLPKINLIGHSRGGITNLQYALDHPDLVSSLISIGTPYFGSSTASVFGELVMGACDGLKDVVDPYVYDEYYYRWDHNYNSLYKNIEAFAIGGYHTKESLHRVIDQDISGEINKIISPSVANFLVDVAFNIVNLSNRSLTGIGTKVVIDFFFNLLSNEFSFLNKIDGVIDLLTVEIFGNIWFNDVLVPLESQLGQEYLRSYAGFNRYKRLFGGNINEEKVSQAQPPVGHNLEARDNTVISYILRALNNSGAQHIVSKKYDGTLRYDGYFGDITTDIFTIPATIDGAAVTEIGSDIFGNQPEGKVKGVVIPASVKTIDGYAFANQIGLTEVEFMSNSQLTQIGPKAFQNCKALTSITLPSSVSILGEEAFVGCDALSSLLVASGNNYFTSSNGILMDKERSEQQNKIYFYPKTLTQTSYTIPSYITEIAPYAFNNENLTSLNLSNVRIIGDGAFIGCSELQTITGGSLVDYIGSAALDATKWFADYNGAYVSIGKVLYAYLGTETQVDLSQYTSISAYCFIGNTYVQKVIIGNSVVNIGDGAFAGCENLSEVYINKKADIVFVGDYAFDMNSATRTIYVPKYFEDQYKTNAIWSTYVNDIDVFEIQLKFNSAGGTFHSPKEVAYGGEVGELPVPTKTGYEFIGWYSNSVTKITESTVWWDNQPSITLEAHWEPINYLIIYAEVYAATDIYEAESEYYTIANSHTLITPNRDGYVFAGWYTDPSCTSGRVYSIPTGSTGDRKYYAKWTNPPTSTNSDEISVVTFVTNCDEIVAPIIIKKGAYTTLETISPIGRVFKGWYTEQNGGGVCITNGTLINAPWSYTGPVTLYAYLETLEYTISYHMNGGSGDVGARKYTVDSSSILLTNPTRTGYRFMGWFNNSYVIGDPTQVIPQGSYGDIDLYAKWEKEYVFKFYNSAKIEIASNITYGIYNEIIQLPECDPGFNWDGLNPLSSYTVHGDRQFYLRSIPLSEMYNYEGDYYEVWNYDQLREMYKFPSCNFKIMTSIYVPSGAAPWMPIESFTGVIDGNNQIISGLEFSHIKSNIGFINSNKGTIKNLRITDVEININTNSGMSGNISVGVIAVVNEESGIISNCNVGYMRIYSEAHITSNFQANIGAVCGSNQGTIQSTYVIYFGASAYGVLGGLVGTNSGNIMESGIGSSNLDIYWGEVGGIAGVNGGTIFDCEITTTCISCYNGFPYDSYYENQVKYVIAGGIVGNNNNGIVINCDVGVQTTVTNFNSEVPAAFEREFAPEMGAICGRSTANNVMDCTFLTGTVSPNGLRTVSWKGGFLNLITYTHNQSQYAGDRLVGRTM